MGGRGNSGSRNTQSTKVEPNIVVEASDRLGNTHILDNTETYFISRSGGIVSEYGEPAKLVEAQEKHLIFKTESGETFKTDYQLRTVGKAKKAGYEFTPHDLSNEKYMKRSKVTF